MKKKHLTLKERRELIQKVNDSAVILFEYYLAKAGIENYEFTDEKASQALGWTERKVKDIRLKLIKAGWFAQRKGKYNDGRKIITTYLGKERVDELFQQERYTLKEKEEV